MAGCEVCQEAEVLTTAVTLEPGKHHQWDIESDVFQQLVPIIHIFLVCINAGLHLSVSFYISRDLGPQAFNGGFALKQRGSVLCEFFYLAL